MAKLRMLQPRFREARLSVLDKDDRGRTREERERKRDERRRSEQPWRAWYKLEIWDHPEHGLRAQQLQRRPICETCRSAPATIAHHKRPHQGVWQLFADPFNLESACKKCHDGAIQRGERAGNYTNHIDLHEAGDIAANVLYPQMRRSAVPLTLVCGPPAAGKSRYVDAHKQSGDVVIDVDLIIADFAGTALRSNEIKRAYLQNAMIERNRRLHALTRECGASHGAWLIIGAASGSERTQWARRLGAVRVIVLETPADECIARIHRDAARAQIAAEQACAVHEWWARYSPAPGDEIIRG